jgi:hypothetical protein
LQTGFACSRNVEKARQRRGAQPPGVGPVVPRPRAETPHFLAQDERIAGVGVSVEFVDSARRIQCKNDLRAVLIELLVPTKRRVRLVIEFPAVARIRIECRVFEVCLYVIEVVLVIVRIGRAVREERCVVEKVVISKLRHVGARRIGRVRRVIPDIDHAAVEAQTGLVGKTVLVFAVTGIALLVVERLIAVRSHSVDVEEDRILLMRPEQIRLEIKRIELCVERAVSERTARQQCL